MSRWADLLPGILVSVSAQESYDLVIANGTVVDGSGSSGWCSEGAGRGTGRRGGGGERLWTTLAGYFDYVVKKGLAANTCCDVGIFDAGVVADQSAYFDSHQYPVGIPCVIVNGVVDLDNGNHTRSRAGAGHLRSGISEEPVGDRG